MESVRVQQLCVVRYLQGQPFVLIFQRFGLCTQVASQTICDEVEGMACAQARRAILRQVARLRVQWLPGHKRSRWDLGLAHPGGRLHQILYGDQQRIQSCGEAVGRNVDSGQGREQRPNRLVRNSGAQEISVVVGHQVVLCGFARCQNL